MGNSLINTGIAFRELKAMTTSRSGATAIVFALLLPVLIAGVALAVDVGVWRHNARKLQTRADAAAMAGAYEWFVNNSYDSINAASLGLLHDNGFDLNAAVVEVYYPPLTQEYSTFEAVEVRLQQPQPRFFSGLFLDKDPIQNTLSIAVVRRPTEPLCILALDPVEKATLDLNGGAALHVDKCGVQSNSYHVDGLQVSGTSDMEAGCVYSAGGIYGPEKITLTKCASIEENWAPTPDPYRDVTIPEGIDVMACKTPKQMGKKRLYLESGRYCKDVTGFDDTELEAGGTFFFDGAKLEMKSESSFLHGSDVTMFFLNGGSIGLPTGGLMDVSAKSYGDYPGILMFSDPVTTPSTLDVKLTGNADSILEGLLYFPNQLVEYAGGSSSLSECTHLVARRIVLTGNSAFTNQNCSGLGMREISAPAGVILASN